MKQAIEFQHVQADTLIIGARKKQTCNTFLYVHHGSVLLRLGQNEIPVPIGHAFWLPINCLNAMTIIQGAQVSLFNFSVRNTLTLPKSAGFVPISSLIMGIIDTINLNPISSLDWHGPDGRLLRCLRDNLSNVQPTIQYDSQLQSDISVIQRIKKGEDRSENNDRIFSLFGMSANLLAEQLIVQRMDSINKIGDRD